MDNVKRCADGKILMEEAFGSRASSMSHLPQEVAIGQMQLSHLREGKKSENVAHTSTQTDVPKLFILFLMATALL